MVRPKTDTAQRILDLAESFFAERGFDASSMGDIARAVGIRTPSLYSHYANKQALYEAVLGSRLTPLFELLESVNVMPDSAEATLVLLRTVAAHYMDHPELAKLIQHASLAGGEQLAILQLRVYQPLAELLKAHLDDPNLLPDDWDSDKLKLLIINFHSMIFGFITLAPVYTNLLEEELSLPEIRQQQLALLEEMASQLWDRSRV